MLYEFLITNRAELIDRCRLKVGQRLAPKATDAELKHGIPLFLEQIIKTLRLEETRDFEQSVTVSGPASGRPVVSEIGMTAARHGRELMQVGFTVDQVVHDYGDLCQAVMDLALEKKAVIGVEEFRTFNRCMDNAIADAVKEFADHRDSLLEDSGVQAINERLGFLAHELRNYINTATLAVAAIKTGNVGVSGATGAVLDRSLVGLRNLVDRSLADVRVTAGMPPRSQVISVADLIAAVKISLSLEAQTHECGFTIAAVEPGLAVLADRDMLFSAIGNLLQNAFKFTHRHSDVSLHAYANADRILIEVADNCGGLPAGSAEKMFLPFTQGSNNKSGLGLGLTICRRSVEANGGALSVRDIPGYGCVFTIDLPRHLVAVASVPVAAPARG